MTDLLNKLIVIQDDRLPCLIDDIYSVLSSEEVMQFVSDGKDQVIYAICPEYVLCSKDFMGAIMERFPDCEIKTH